MNVTMNWLDLATFADAAAVPIVAVAVLFFGMMSNALEPINEELMALRGDVHAVDVRLARLEVRFDERMSIVRQ